MRTEGEGNNEIIWFRPKGNYGDWEQHGTPRGCGGNGGLGVTQSLVDAFFMEDGTEPILGYNADGSRKSIRMRHYIVRRDFLQNPNIGQPIIYLMDGYNDSNYPDVTPERDGKTLVVQPNTFNMYCHREPRFYDCSMEWTMVQMGKP